MESVKSISSVIIRLTDERWIHITENHPEMAGFYNEVIDTIAIPQSVYEGTSNEYIAIKKTENDPEKYFVVVYRELNDIDGFVITAFLTKRKSQIERRKKIWP